MNRNTERKGKVVNNMTTRAIMARKIREAALGPTPKHEWMVFSWLGCATPEHHAALACLAPAFFYGSNIERRMALLFVAEAVE